MAKKARTAAKLPAARQEAAQEQNKFTRTAGAEQARADNPMVIVHEGGITEEFVHEFCGTKLNYDYAVNWGSFPTKDGKYVYDEWVKDGKKLRLVRRAFSGLSPELMNFLAETDRRATNCQRSDKDHSAPGSQDQDSREDQNGEFRTSARDRVAFQQWVYKESRDSAVDDPVYPDEQLKTHFCAGENRMNNQRMEMRRQVIRQFIPKLTVKQRATLIKYYDAGMSEQEIADEEGVSKQAIEDRLINEIRASLRKVFTQLGIYVPTDAELKEERKREKARWDAQKEQEKEEREMEQEIRIIHTMMTEEAASEPYVEKGGMQHVPNVPTADEMDREARRNGTELDYDSDNAYDSLYDEDYDPYEDSLYQLEEAAEARDAAGYWDDGRDAVDTNEPGQNDMDTGNPDC